MEKFGNCHNCRWWVIPERWYGMQEYACERINSGAGNKSPGARIFPVTSGAFLATAPDFGCTLHEPRKEPT